MPTPGVGTEDPNWDRPWHQRFARFHQFMRKRFGWLRFGP